MTQSDIQSRQFRQVIYKTIVIGILIYISAWVWYGLDTEKLDQRLEVQGYTYGGEAEFKGAYWYHRGEIGDIVPGRTMQFKILVENTGHIDLEPVSAIILLRDPFGRSAAYPPNFILSPRYLKAGEASPMIAGVVNLPGDPLTPLTWTKAYIFVKFRPVRDYTLRTTVHWDNAVVTLAGYNEDGDYHLTGYINDRCYRPEYGNCQEKYVYISYFNEMGDFISYTIILVGEDNKFEGRILQEDMTRGRIASYQVHFIETKIFPPRP